MTEKSTAKDTLTIRLTPEMRRRLDEAKSILPYQITVTAIVERGINLAIDELNALAAKKE
ncbi:hypothetical protein CHY08_07105 [Rhizobium leguminosarum bv. viciae]|uniref:hypothetical protein n=1 Tax=Rhizobium leguminosarum TaxID=384 RepID=UPI000B8C8A56|nr:hypothetical protein [Rhizobium leguminosarum]ASR06904.1 hypothetical protein CHY08_07105 [Rhizobium leguminosarum bv. viciae]